MTAHHDHTRPGDARSDVDARSDGAPQSHDHVRGHGHRWMMIACCIPMLAIAGVIALSGAGFGFFIVAVACTTMMAAMMAGMSGEERGRR